MVRLSTLNPLTSIFGTCGGNGIGVVVVTGGNGGSNGIVGSHDNNGI